MEQENTYTNQYENNEEICSTYFDKNGNPVNKSNVYYRQDGVPYRLINDENGQPQMTREQLIELKETPTDQQPNSSYSD